MQNSVYSLEVGSRGCQGWRVLRAQESVRVGALRQVLSQCLYLICWAEPGQVCLVSGNLARMAEKRFPSRFSPWGFMVHFHGFHKAPAAGCQARLWLWAEVQQSLRERNGCIWIVTLDAQVAAGQNRDVTTPSVTLSPS